MNSNTSAIVRFSRYTRHIKDDYRWAEYGANHFSPPNSDGKALGAVQFRLLTWWYFIDITFHRHFGRQICRFKGHVWDAGDPGVTCQRCGAWLDISKAEIREVHNA